MVSKQDIVSIAVAGIMIASGLVIFTPVERQVSDSVGGSVSTSAYELQNYVSIWQRKNTWIGEGVDGNPDPSASASMAFFGTNNLVLSDMLNPHGYSWAEVSNPSLIPADATLIIQLGLGSVSNAVAIATDIANHAKTDPRIIGVEWDDFRVGQESPAKMTAIYNAVHHEDANLSQGPLKLGLVVYTFNYFDQSPYSWANVSAYLDVINFWFSPSDTAYYFSEYGERNGYYDTFMELTSWLPTKEFKLGIYLHMWNAGPGNKEYAYSGQLEQLLFGARLIREGYATGWTILENTFITADDGVGHNSAHLVRNFLFQEFLPNYSSVIIQPTLAVTSTMAGISIEPITRSIVSDPLTGGFKLFSDHLQWVEVQSAWSGPTVQNVVTGEFAEVGTLSGGFRFLADTGCKYRVYDWTATTTTYTTDQYILTPTTWHDKSILFESRLYVNSSLDIDNCVIRFADYQHNNTVANGTAAHYGLFLNASGVLTVDNSTFEPENRQYPYYFDLTGAGDAGYSKVFSAHNSTFACYAGDIRAYGYFQMYDSVVYMPTTNGGLHYGISLLAPTFTNDLDFERNLVSLPQSKDARLIIQPGTGAVIDNNIIVGGGGYNDFAFNLENTFSAPCTWRNITLAPMTLNETGGDGASSYHIAWGEFEGPGADWGYFNMTRNFILKGSGITSFGGVLKNATGSTIASLSTTNGTIITEVPYLSHTNHTTIHNPFPWTFQVTSGLVSGSFYQVRDEAFWNGGYSQMMSPRTLEFNSSTFTINRGQNLGLVLEQTISLTVGTTSYIASSGTVTTLSQAFWQPWNYTGVQSVPVFGKPTSGVLTISLSSYSLSGNPVVRWTAEGIPSTSEVTFDVSGLTTGVAYKVYVDSNILATLTASGGHVSFAYSIWSTHTFEIVIPTTYEPPDDVSPAPSDKSPGTSDPGTTSFSWTSPALIAIVSCSALVALVLLLRRPRGRSGTRHN